MEDSNLKHLVIELDRRNGTYRPGERISGKVSVHFTRAEQIRGLQVTITGESVVRWSSEKDYPLDRSDSLVELNQPTIATIMTDREEYFSYKLFLLGHESGLPFVLPAGQFAYPFECQLPLNIPYSFRHEHGYVGYSIKANFYKPATINDQIMIPFTIIPSYDLNRKQKASSSIREEMIKDFFCSCIYPTGKIYARLSVPWTGFVPGQMIPITVHCENESTIDVKKIKVSLWKKFEFHVKSPYQSTKVVESIVARNNRLTPFTNNSEESITMQIKVPPLPPTSLEHCGLIDVDYELRIVICFSGMHFSIKRRFPILIGTVPLFESVLSSTAHPSHWDSQNLSPSSYCVSTFGSRIIRDKNQSVAARGDGNFFGPPYPVHGYSPASI